jgi:ABC-type transport system involved in multi-copper enzyme maturation permease subunit
MSSKLVTTEKRDDTSAPDDWSGREVAPSVMREDEASLPRTVGMIGAFLVIFGGLVLLLKAFDRSSFVSPSWAMLSIAVGVAGLLYHAAFDRDVQFRRMYMLFGFLALVFGAFLCVLPYPNAAGNQFGPGFLCMSLALVFLLAFHRNETDAWTRNLAELAIGGAGLLMAVVGLLGANIKAEFLMPFGFLLGLLGLFYLSAFVAMRGVGDDLAYRTGLGIGLAGLLVFLVALGRSALPPLFHWAGWLENRPAVYHVPTGVLLMTLGLAYGLVSLGICSDRPLVVLTRRELGAYFYSPVAYLVMAFCACLAWVNFLMFLLGLLPSQGLASAPSVPEPVVGSYFIAYVPAVGMVLAVPFLTMRSLSEERRSGTLEVLLTGPVTDTTVVLSKFLAALFMYLVLWVPYGLFLIALYLITGTPFDYRPLLGFFVVTVVTGAGFVSLGLFFSSLTTSQIISGLLTFGAMFVLFLIYFLKRIFLQGDANRIWGNVLTHISYIDAWDMAMDGKMQPAMLLFSLSLTVFCLFLTVKVLESRKWK